MAFRMILTCPNCSTRYQADAAKFPAHGRNVRCAKCGHQWLQVPPAPEPEPDIVVVTTPAPEPPPPSVETPRSRPSAFAPTPAPNEAQQSHSEIPSPSPPLGRTALRAGTIAGWTALAVLLIAGGWAVFTFRGDIARHWPQSASLYKAVGLPVNASGISFANVRNSVETENGEHVLVVSGKLVNTSSRIEVVPQIRIALTDAERRELYHWPVVANVPVLKPGQSAPFRARLANPPGAMADVEVSFYRADE